MGKKLSKELIEKIRKDVGEGKSRYDVAEELNLDTKTVYRYTDDFPKKHGRVSEELKSLIKEELMNGATIMNIHKKTGVSVVTIWKMGKTIENGETLRGLGLTFLKSITRDGFFVTDTLTQQRSRDVWIKLRKDIPIMRVISDRVTVYFLKGKEKEAMRGFLEKRKKTTASYYDLNRLSRIFGVRTNTNDKKEVMNGKFHVEKFSKKFKKMRKLSSKNRNHQAKFSDFIGRFLHSELLTQPQRF